MRRRTHVFVPCQKERAQNAYHKKTITGYGKQSDSEHKRETADGAKLAQEANSAHYP